MKIKISHKYLTSQELKIIFHH